MATTHISDNLWKEAVIDALVVGCIYRAEHEDDPKKALADLISWEVQIALDPAVSSSAQDLIERGRQEVLGSRDPTAV